MLYWTFPANEWQGVPTVGELSASRWFRGVSRPLASYREATDDFFCLRYRVWYPSVDCAYRTFYRTCPGCSDCEQGRFNLKRHRAKLLYGQYLRRRGG